MSVDIRYIVTGFTEDGRPMTSSPLQEYPTLKEIEKSMQANRLIMLEVKRVYLRELEQSALEVPEKKIILPN